MYNGGGGYNTRSATARQSSTGVARVLISNLDYGVSDGDIKVTSDPISLLQLGTECSILVCHLHVCNSLLSTSLTDPV